MPKGHAPVRFDEREASDADADSLLFEDDLAGDPRYGVVDLAPVDSYTVSHHPATTALLHTLPRRARERELRRKRRRRRLLLLLVLVLLVGTAGGGWLAYRSLYGPKDWTG